MRRIKLMLAMFVMGVMYPLVSFAQIAYQVSLLNASTGEPRANVSVEAEVTITNSDDKEIYKETKSATSNDFGVIQLTVGNQSTFKDVDWSKLPFFIEVSVDGTVIGKSQILTVPIAEAAKYLAPGIDIEDIVGTWIDDEGNKLVLYSDGTGVFNYYYGDKVKLSYEIEGKTVYIYRGNIHMYPYRIHNGKLYGYGVYFKQ